jgi:group II intron reverse transcriptase/maturase
MEPIGGTMKETSSSPTISTKLERIAKLARELPDKPLTTLAHHIDADWMREAYRRTRKDGARGIDGRSAEQFAERLEENLQSLLGRAKSGEYRAPPVRRVHIPKGDGSQTRPIGIPTFEDKVLQRAVAMVLEAVYEQSFCDFSYGFRPRRSAHDACEALQNATVKMGGGWVLEVDIKKFFDTLDHGKLQAILSQRIRDGVISRLIGKWLNAGVMEGLVLSHPDAGTPQGGVISPLLANIYLHEVLDEWFVHLVQPRLMSRAVLVRYADDFVFVFAQKEDADRVFQVLPKRFGKYGLTLHPDKTRLVPFHRPGRGDGGDGGGPSTFDLLGFTHHWGLSRNGKWTVKKRTAKDRFSRTLRRISQWCRMHRHDDVEAQHLALVRKLRGHYAYFGVTSNHAALERLRHKVESIWQKWLSRRSQKGYIPWPAMSRFLKRFPLPKARIVHRYGT